MKRWILGISTLFLAMLTGFGCHRSSGPEGSSAPGFSLILRITSQATRLWLWDTTGTPLTTAEVQIAGTPVPYVPESACYFLARGIPASGPFLLEVRDPSGDLWLQEIQTPSFRGLQILSPSEGEVFPRNADLWVYWVLEGEATRGAHQVQARYLGDSTVVYRSDSLAASQTFWAVPASVLGRSGNLRIQVFSGMYQPLPLPDPPAHAWRPLDFGGSYAALVYADSVTVSVGYPGAEAEVWRGNLQGRGQGAWNRVDSLFQMVMVWDDTTEFFQKVLSWPPQGDTLLGPWGDSLRLVADSLTADSVWGRFWLWGPRSDSGAWWGGRIP